MHAANNKDFPFGARGDPCMEELLDGDVILVEGESFSMGCAAYKVSILECFGRNLVEFFPSFPADKIILRLFATL